MSKILDIINAPRQGLVIKISFSQGQDGIVTSSWTSWRPLVIINLRRNLRNLLDPFFPGGGGGGRELGEVGGGGGV